MSNPCPIIDCDVHHAERSKEELCEFLREPYRTEVGKFGYRMVSSGIRYEEGGSRQDARPPDGGWPGTDPVWVGSHHLDKYGIEFAFLSGWTGAFAGVPDPDYAAAICSAFNDFTIARWLPVDARFRMGIHVPLQDPALAVREIERLGDHPGVIGVCFFGTANRIPFGQRYYWPIYEAAVRKGLPIHFHPSTTAVIANAASTAAGMATTYLESHASLPQFYMAYLASFIFEGVFEKLPALRVIFVEGGFSWLPHMLWRMDKEFKGLRQQAPFLKRLPSEYVRDNVRLTTQPIEEPGKSEHLAQIFDMIGADDTLMYASDYPHWDFDEPSVLPRQLSDATRRKILHDNAAALFNLPAAAR